MASWFPKSEAMFIAEGPGTSGMSNPNRRRLVFGVAASGGALIPETLRAATPGETGQRAAGVSNIQLGAPAVLRGSVYAHRAPGVTLGPGQTRATQAATLVGLQAALDDAAATNRFFEIEPNVYEIFGPAGLIIRAEARNFKWAGSVGSRLVQFRENAPILTIGDTGKDGYAAHQVITGFSLDYGVGQAGKAGAIALVLGSAAWNVVEQFIVCTNYMDNPPSMGLAVTTTSASNKFFFQNTIRNGEIGGGQVSLLSVKMDGTGNLWEDIYTHFGSDAASRQTCSGPAWDLDPPGQMDDNVFVRCNIEHVNSTAMIHASGALNTTFIGLHIEDVGLTGPDPAVVSQSGGQLRFIQSLIMDLALARAEGRAAVHRAAGYGERAAFDDLHFKWSSYSSRALNSDTRVVAPPTFHGNDTNPAISISNLTVQDDPGDNGAQLMLNVVFDQPLIDGTFIATARDDNLLPTTRQLQTTIQAAYTHFGMHEDAVLFVPPAITNFTITLSDRFKASGAGSTLAPRPGARLRIRRRNGAATGALTVVDAATSATLTTNTASGVDYVYAFVDGKWICAD
jgi:hypothetical protein